MCVYIYMYIYIYVYICIYVYAAPAATQSVRCYSKRTRVTKRPRLFKASDACQSTWLKSQIPCMIYALTTLCTNPHNPCLPSLCNRDSWKRCSPVEATSHVYAGIH